MNSQDVMTAQGKVGPQTVADGVYTAIRMGKTGEQVVSNVHGKYHEAASRGKLFIATIPVAGVAPGTALSTTPAFQIWNPLSSGILVSIKQVFVGYLSGTLGAGFFAHAQNASQVTAPSGGTELTPVCALLNGTRGSARAFTGSTISATSTLIRASGNISAADGTDKSLSMPLVMDEVDGGIVIPAGVVWCFQGVAAAGTSPKVVISAVYEEITLPS